MDDGLKLIVGLGNPGRQYEHTRHNAGFIVLDRLAARWGDSAWQKRFDARYVRDRTRNAILIEPQSYMNLSGRPAQGFATLYKVPPQRVLVVVDDLDLPLGTLRLRASGSSGGHNGLKSLIEVFGTGFPRLRIGIGRGHAPDAIDRVLGTFTESERTQLDAIVERAIEGIEIWLSQGVMQAMNVVNAKGPP
ncbi:MAG TPA: aminoacyl-tRNA hydrolase [Candidatus Elarobacter sp.]|nr:aminoacyl-tRNA hydrolase [Candidatus Elarobacter sp.]